MVCRLDKSASFRIFDSTFYCPHSALRNSTFYLLPARLSSSHPLGINYCRVEATLVLGSCRHVGCDAYRSIWRDKFQLSVTSPTVKTEERVLFSYGCVLCFSVFESVRQVANGRWALDWSPVFSRPGRVRSAETGSGLKPELHALTDTFCKIHQYFEDMNKSLEFNFLAHPAWQYRLMFANTRSVWTLKLNII